MECYMMAITFMYEEQQMRALSYMEAGATVHGS